LNDAKREIITAQWPIIHGMLDVPPKNDEPAYASWVATIHKIIIAFADHFPEEENAVFDGAGLLHSMDNWHRASQAIRLHWTHRKGKEAEIKLQDCVTCLFG
jgi:hypothetical protein